MAHSVERNPGIPLDLGWINSVQARLTLLITSFHF
jgi:hypothetical protein